MSGKDEKFLAGKSLGGRPAVVEERINTPVKAHKPRVLTAQEWKFVEEFVSGDGHVTLKEAAIRAGYSEVWAKNRSRELTDPEQSPHIVAAIQERRRELGEKYGTTFERHMRDLQVIRDPLTGIAFPGNIIPADRLNPVGSKLANYLPRPNIGNADIDTGTSNFEIGRAHV